MISDFPPVFVNISVVTTEVSETSSCVSSYHNYKDVWDTVIGMELQCEREPDHDTNKSNRYAVTIKRWDNHQ